MKKRAAANSKVRKKRNAQAGPAVSSKKLATFLWLSTVLTGEQGLDRDLAEAYLKRAQDQGWKLDALLNRFDALASSGLDLIEALRTKIFPDPELGPVARQVLMLWYGGGIRTNTPNGEVWDFGSADQFYRALVWGAIGAHPPTLSNGYYGHWKYPPEQ
jgi:hypothetical protein